MDLYKNYVTESFDKDGVLKEFDINCPDDYNFAFDIVDKIADEQPDRRALVWCNVAGEKKEFTYGELKDLSNRAANLFSQYGIKKGDMVMLILKRHYQFWISILALHKIGAIAIPATNLLTVKDIVYRINAASVSAVVVTPDNDIPEKIVEAQDQCQNLFKKFIVRSKKEGFIDFDYEINKCSKEFKKSEDCNKEDDMLLYFTSGTTGYPKMVIHPQTYSLAHIPTAKYWQNVDPDGLHLTVSETGWGKAAWGKLYGQMIMGTAIFVYDFDKFVPHELLQKIEEYKITTFCAPPTIFRFFIKEGMGQYDVSSLKYATVAGEALNLEVYKQFLNNTGVKLMEGFGQTETTLLIANLVGSQIKPGSMGKPTPLYNVALVDNDANEVPQGEVGEIVVIPKSGHKAYGVFKSYFRDPVLTENAWRQGIYHTGDTAFMDEDGFYWYVGRTDDIIKSSGYRIGPFEIESVLMEHPSVLECAITGIPDPVRGQIVKATIVLTSQYTASEQLKKELQDYVKNATAPYKYPRLIEFVSELPKTISGKIRRVEIRSKDQSSK